MSFYLSSIVENAYLNPTKNSGSQNVQKETPNADAFEEWNSQENVDKFLAGETVEEFQMFDAPGEHMGKQDYIDNLMDFSQEMIDKYDADGDGNWSLDEFSAMSMDGQAALDYIESLDPEGLLSDADKEALVKEFQAQNEALFEGFQLDEDADTISAEEFASQLYVADMDDYGVVDGSVDFAAFNLFATDPNSDPARYQDELTIRKNVFELSMKPWLGDEAKA